MTDSVKYCVYKHTSPDGMSYIGRTKDMHRRNLEHSTKFIGCRAFYSAVKKYGWGAFTHSVLEDGLTLEEAYSKEAYYIELHNTRSPNGYNLTTGGYRGTHSEESKKLMSIANKGRPVSEEAKLKLSIANTGEKHPQYGKHRPEETRKKISEAHKGVKLSPEHVESIRRVRIGKKASDETKRRMSEAGKGRRHTKEARLKMSIATTGSKNHMYGKVVSEETRKKLSAAHKGRPSKRVGIPIAEETKQKISAAHKGVPKSAEAIEKSRKARSLWYEVTHPCGKKEILHGLSDFCKEHKLSAGRMSEVANGSLKHYKKFTCVKIEAPSLF